MSAETLLSNRKASQIFFALVRKNSRPAGLARACDLDAQETERLLGNMEKAGLVDVQRGVYRIDWDRFLPIFLRQAMNVYAAAMPWKYIPYYMEQGEQDFVEASCARAERELARVKVKLAANDLFLKVVQSYYEILSTDALAPDDYLQDLRVADTIDEFEYALLKLLPSIRRQKRSSKQARELFRLLHDWYKQIQDYDTPTGAALRAAFQEHGLL